MIATLLERTNMRVLALVRAASAREGMRRIRAAVGPHASERDIVARVEAIPGDLRKPPWEDDAQLFERMHREVTTIIHMAAATDLFGERDKVMAINVGGTEKIVSLAASLERNGRFERLAHFSTAFVVGSSKGRTSEEAYPCPDPAWANAYEESKYVAEGLVHEAAAGGLPTIVFRPSIVVGDSQTGAISSFGIFYHMVRRVKRSVKHSGLRFIPGRPDDRLQIVPIDFVCEATVAISGDRRANGRIFHLSSDNPPTIATLLEVGGRTYDWIAALRPVDPAKISTLAAFLPEAERLLPTMGYLSSGLVFDNSNTREMLRDTGVPMPDTGEAFVEKLVNFVEAVEYA